MFLFNYRPSHKRQYTRVTTPCKSSQGAYTGNMSNEVASFYQQKEWKPTCISYSYASYWYGNREGFRRKYYKNEEPAFVPAFQYGSEISDLIKKEPEHPLFVNLPRYSSVDDEYRTMLGDVPFVFHPDMYEPSTFSFREIKTGMRTSSGKPSWTDLKVKKHKQLDCYSLGIETLFGEVDPTCHLDWLVKDKTQIEIIDGIMADGPAVFNGEVISFERTITPIERYAAKEWLLQAFHEISNDYEAYQRNS